MILNFEKHYATIDQDWQAATILSAAVVMKRVNKKEMMCLNV
jgi:hypothetical protein